MLKGCGSNPNENYFVIWWINLSEINAQLCKVMTKRSELLICTLKMIATAQGLQISVYISARNICTYPLKGGKCKKNLSSFDRIACTINVSGPGDPKYAICLHSTACGLLCLSLTSDAQLPYYFSLSKSTRILVIQSLYSPAPQAALVNSCLSRNVYPALAHSGRSSFPWVALLSITWNDRTAAQPSYCQADTCPDNKCHFRLQTLSYCVALSAVVGSIW